MSNSLTTPGRIVFGLANYTDGRPSRGFADLVGVDPRSNYRMMAVGLGKLLAGSPPWEIGQTLPGIPFGEAVSQTLPPAVRADIIRGKGRVFTELEVADFLRPVLDAAARGETILAGVQNPPSADPTYTVFSPVMLPHWRFVAGVDRAYPKITGAVEYVSLRLFTGDEFAYVERCGGRLRPVLASENHRYRTGAAGRPSSVHLAQEHLRYRHAAGQTKGTLSAECAAIVDWLKEEHPDAPPLKPKSLAEQLRNDYRRLCHKL